MPKGTVKWFNNAKGYGFIIEDGQSEDLFAHFSSIQMEGYKTLKAGQPVFFDKQAGDKGFHAVNITAAEVSKPNTGMDIDHDEFISVEEPTAQRIESTQANSVSREQTQSIVNSVTA